MEKAFEKASRGKLRFETPRGLLGVEDIWDLPLKGGDTNLDELAKAYHRELKTDGEVSFVDDPPEPNEELQLRFDVVKRVIDVKLAEQKAAETAEEKRQLKQEILAAIKAKQTEELKESSIDDLQARLAEL
jgi:hypothetical protein